MADASFMGKVLGAASQGAVGAFVGATLSAVTEPVVNKVLVERKAVSVALSEHTLAKIQAFIKTTMATNMLKFPFFEVVNMIMNTFTLPPSVRGTVTGMVFTSVTLPVTNYRFRMSMNLPIGGLSGLYQAFGATVARDIVYGVARNNMTGWLMARNPKAMQTASGRFKTMFMTVLFSCVVSAPGNELRGFILQPKGREKPFLEFFDPVKTIRSTTIGGLIMSISLATGVMCTPFVEQFVQKFKAHAATDPLGALLLFIVLADKLTQSARMARMEKALEDKKA